MSVILLSGCSIDNESGPNVAYDLVAITGNDLPESFEKGKTYEVNVTYELPNQCYAFNSLDARRAGSSSEQRRKIYVGAISLVNLSGTCDESSEGDTGTSKFTILIDEDGEYEFNFWIGKDSTGQSLYDKVTVPVVDNTNTGA
ncbi:hypothetical protein C7S20_06170 [Christiangramia fulva]|uniref:Uncharacterized protein n=2 Tax=Christiangramia fulva TaxID=2126553 RepID=A0A2R3Z3P5_9FLAO|nr:hypothetical protein C7S20_06170 [Christiangramia fulva]